MIISALSPVAKSLGPRGRELFLLIAVATTQTCCLSDPFDPWLGPPNPRPAASRYLFDRKDIPETEKRALLDYQPCSQPILTRLAEAPIREVRFLVGINSGADPTVLQRLAADRDSMVRQAVALNRNTPETLLLKLSKDPNQNVRFAVTRNPNWPH